MLSPSTEFKTMHIVSAARLLTRGPRIDTGAPGPDRHAPYVTTVIRLPADLARSVHSTLAPIVEHHPGHYFYPPWTLHITVTGFAAQNPSELEAIERALDRALAHNSPIEIKLIGLNLSPSTLLIQAFPSDDAIARLRKGISNAISEQQPRLRLPRRPFLSQRIAFTNVLRFLGPVDHWAVLRDLKEWNNHDFGQFNVEEIQLVTTDKFLSYERTSVLRRYSFP